MGFFANLFRRSQPSHGLQITDRAADVLKHLISENRNARLQDHCVVVHVNMDMHLLVDIRPAAGHMRSRDHALAVVKQLNVVIPLELAEYMESMTLDYDQATNRIVFADGGFDSLASDPGHLTLSKAKIAKLNPNLQPATSPIEHGDYEELVMGLYRGDTRAALVVQLSPLVVAAYTDELDDVALLQFPDWLVDEHQLDVGTRLLSVNLFIDGDKIAPDLVAGPFFQERFVNFVPRIAEFLSDDHEAIETHKSKITESEWNRTLKFAKKAIERANGNFRNGIPPNSHVPAQS